jgi:transcriptional regulator with XRE-family HTH domain
MRQEKLENSPEPTHNEGPNPVDIHVGSRLKLRRILIGMSQDQMGKALGLTFQQIQKYERGINRMGASRLYQMSKLLNVPIAWFFDELPDTSLQRLGFNETPQETWDDIPTPSPMGAEILQKRETLNLVRAYYNIPDPKQRRKVLELLKSMAEAQ